MKVFAIGADIGLIEITSYQDTQWAFGNFFVTFGPPKMIAVDADEIFDGMSKKNFQETLLIPLHEVAMGNKKAIRNESFHKYLNKVHNIN